MRKRAFTLIELLVVIAVIAVLMGILMPSLQKAREQAKIVRCGSNLRQIVLALATYTESNDGKLTILFQIIAFDMPMSKSRQQRPRNCNSLRIHENRGIILFTDYAYELGYGWRRLSRQWWY